MEIRVLVQRFCDEARQFQGFTDATIRRYRSVVEMFSTKANILQIDAIDAASVRSWFFHGRTERHWSIETFRTYHKSLKVFFRWCRRYGWLQIDPLSDLAVPKPERRLPKRLTREEAMRLLEIANNYPWADSFVRYRNHGIVATFLFAGLRKSELLHLAYADVDLAGLSLFVRRGKGRKDRIVPISQTLAEILNRYMEERRKRQKTCPEFFARRDTNTGLSQEVLRRFIATLERSSGITFTVHQLRHTFATLMLEGGCDIYSLSQMMGHEDIKVTTIYLSASAEHLRAQMTKHPLSTESLERRILPAVSGNGRHLAWSPESELQPEIYRPEVGSFVPVLPRS